MALFDTKAMALKAAIARRKRFRAGFKKAVRTKQPDANRFKIAIKTVKVRRLKGKPRLYEVVGQ